MTIKNIFSKIHLTLGIASGLIVFIISITGALYAFRDEIEDATQSYRHVQEEEKQVILPSTVFAAARKAIPDTKIHGAHYNGKHKSIEVVFYQAEPFFYGAAYINPYSGETLHTQNYLSSFFGLVLIGHTSLWLPPSIGSPIIKIMVIIYFVLLLTGIVMWWPRKNQKGGSFSFSKTKNRLVKVRELHQVLAFYASFFILIMLLTGSVWLFKSFEDGIYHGLGGQKETSFAYPKSDTTKVATPQHLTITPADSIFKIVTNEFGASADIEIHEPSSKASSVLVEVNRDPSTFWKMDYLFYDQYTLKEIRPKHIYGRYDEAEMPELVRRLNYDVHSGGVGGFFTKLLACFVSLLSASFPVTGFLFWWMKKRKKKENKKKKSEAVGEQFLRNA